jgi:hypothetical protein
MSAVTEPRNGLAEKTSSFVIALHRTGLAYSKVIIYSKWDFPGRGIELHF